MCADPYPETWLERYPKDAVRRPTLFGWAVFLLAALFLLVLAVLIVSIAYGQSWQQQAKRGKQGGLPSEYVTYQDLDASITSVQQYENMLEVKQAEVATKQDEVMRRLDHMDAQHADIRIAIAEQDVRGLYRIMWAILGGVGTLLLDMAHRRLKKGN